MVEIVEQDGGRVLLHPAGAGAEALPRGAPRRPRRRPGPRRRVHPRRRDSLTEPWNETSAKCDLNFTKETGLGQEFCQRGCHRASGIDNNNMQTEKHVVPATQHKGLEFFGIREHESAGGALPPTDQTSDAARKQSPTSSTKLPDTPNEDARVLGHFSSRVKWPPLNFS